MVDFTNIRKEDEIKAKLHSLTRQGRNRAIEFPPIEVADFMIQVHATDTPHNPKWGAWQAADLAKLKRIPELNFVSVKIYQKRPKSELIDAVQVYSDKRFKDKTWSPKFVQTTGKITPDELVEVIRYLQVLTDMVAFL